MVPSIEDQVVDYFGRLFGWIFSEPFEGVIEQRLKRNAVIRQVEESADAASQSVARFFLNEKLSLEQVTEILSGFGPLGELLKLEAIGNENHGNTSSPGSAHNALSVGAVEKMPRGKIEVVWFSSGASLSFPGQEPPAVTKPDVVAPGVQVYSCIPPEETPQGTFEYTYMDGTSMAIPHVAGVAALLMAAKPDAPAADIMEAVKDTAKHPLGKSHRPDNRWGYGLVRPMEALAGL